MSHAIETFGVGELILSPCAGVIDIPVLRRDTLIAVCIGVFPQEDVDNGVEVARIGIAAGVALAKGLFEQVGGRFRVEYLR